MSKIRKPNGKRVRVKPKKGAVSKARVANHRKRRVDVSNAGKKAGGTRASVPHENVEPPVAVVTAPDREARRTMPLLFWTRLPFAIMDIWFSPFRRKDNRTRA
jgi:hypothetical protein